MAGADERPVTGQELGQRLCAVLGLDPNRTRRIVLELEAGALAEITVEQTLPAHLAPEFVATVTAYGLHRVDQRRDLPPGFTIRDVAPLEHWTVPTWSGR